MIEGKAVETGAKFRELYSRNPPPPPEGSGQAPPKGDSDRLKSLYEKHYLTTSVDWTPLVNEKIATAHEK